jgi:hypothetical protein
MMAPNAASSARSSLDTATAADSTLTALTARKHAFRLRRKMLAL